MQVIPRMANKKPKPLNRASFIHNSRETIEKALRMVSDGITKEEAAKAVGVKVGTVKTWMRKFNVQQDSFLSDPDLALRLSNYNQTWSLSADKKAIPEPEWQGKMPDPTYEVIVTEEIVQQPEPESLMLPAPVEEIQEAEENTQLVEVEEKPPEKPKVKILGEGLSEKEKEKMAKSIRIAIGDKTVNDLHNAVTALVAGMTERIKHVDNHTEAIEMLSSAIAIKQLAEILDAPPMAMNWNDVSKIMNIIREANNMGVPEVKEKIVKVMVPQTRNIAAPIQQAPVPEQKRQINVTILAQKPPRFTKTVDAEVTEG